MNNSVDFKHVSVYGAPEVSPGFLLWQVSTLWRSSIEAILKKQNLTHPQFVVLATVAWLTKDGNRVTQAAAGKMAGLDPNTMSQIVRGLETKKLIKRLKSADVRAKNPMLTAKGSEVLTKALPAVEKADAHFFKSIEQKELENILVIFQKLAIK